MPTETEFRTFASSALSSVPSAEQTTTPGDFNGDGTVDAADYTIWRDGLATDFGSDGYYVWYGDFGNNAQLPAPATSVPEPGSLFLVALTTLSCCATRRS